MAEERVDRSAEVDEFEVLTGECPGHHRRAVEVFGEAARGLSGEPECRIEPRRRSGLDLGEIGWRPVERHLEFRRRRERAGDLGLVVAGEEAATVACNDRSR